MLMKTTRSEGKRSMINVNLDRRHFLSAAAMTLTAAQLSLTGCADAQANAAQPAEQSTMKPGTHTSFASLKQINAGLLNIGYAEDGPSNGLAVILLHGWP